MVSLINTVNTDHEDMIHDAQIDFYGSKLATCSSDATIRIFGVHNGQHTLEAELREHKGPVWQLAWAHPMFGVLLASCSYDRRLIVWKEQSVGRWMKLYEYSNHDSSTNSVHWAPHQLGLIVACASSDGSISVLTYNPAGTWDAQKIAKAHTIGCNSVSWAPDMSAGGVFDAQPHKPVKRFVSGGCDNLVKIWREDGDQWTEECRLDYHSDWVRDVAWAPSVSLQRQLIASCSQDRRVVIWTCNSARSATGGESQTGGGASWTPMLLASFPDVVWHVSWSVTGNILAVSGGDNKVSLWKETLDSKWVCLSETVAGKSQNTAAHSEVSTKSL